jgi:hypothetical protein
MLQRPLAWLMARRTLCGAVVSLLCVLAVPAHAAGLTGDSVTAQLLSPNGVLIDPTPVDLSDTRMVGAGIEISAGDGSNVGGFMLTGAGGVQEAIDFDAFTISLRILAGDVNAGGAPVTGYAGGGKYVFSDLDIAGSTIIGISVSAAGSDITNLAALDAANWITLDNDHQISVMLDDIVFVDKAGTDFADVTIRLLVSDVQPPNPAPEPGSLALAGLALASLGVASRRRTRQG